MTQTFPTTIPNLAPLQTVGIHASPVEPSAGAAARGGTHTVGALSAVARRGVWRAAMVAVPGLLTHARMCELPGLRGPDGRSAAEAHLHDTLGVDVALVQETRPDTMPDAVRVVDRIGPGRPWASATSSLRRSSSLS